MRSYTTFLRSYGWQKSWIHTQVSLCWPELALEAAPSSLQAPLPPNKLHQRIHKCTHTHCPENWGAKPQVAGLTCAGALHGRSEPGLPSCSLCRTQRSCPGSPAPPRTADTGRGHCPARSAAWSPAAPPAACGTGHRVRGDVLPVLN